ncbi:MAG: thioredoxin domain-containing protein [Gemmatimonadetes bacterium]|nr:thioredoxin domain-containing protein [Gemmatimonadota bacterium]
MDASSVSLTLAFAAGVVSFLSPCVLPLVPSYLSLITGLSLDELAAEGSASARRRAAVHSLLFTLGFGAVFLTLGAAATGFGQAFGRALPLLGRIGGVVIVVLGLHLLGVIRAPALDRQRRPNIGARPAGAAGSVIAGVAFAAGWTPCVGPILASILLYSTLQATVGRGMLLLTLYTLGFAVPFVVAAVAFNWFLVRVKRVRRWAVPLERGAGAILVLVGLLMVAGRAPAGAPLARGWSAPGERGRAAAGVAEEPAEATGTGPAGSAGPMGGAAGAGGESTTAEGGEDPGPSDAGAGRVEAPGDREAREAGESRDADVALSQQLGVDLQGLGYDLGTVSAAVTVVEFSDFGCPYCRQFATQTFPALYNEFVSTGKVRWKYVPFVLGIFPHGEEAARAAECAGEQGKFLPMHHRLYEAQSEWKGADDAVPLFSSYAEAIGLNPSQFAACFQQGRRDERTRAANRAASQLAIRGTPTFFIEGFPVQGAVPLEPLREFLTKLIAEKTGAP